MNILVTGAAGFIGSALCLRILAEQLETTVIGIDNVNDYYDVNIKKWRLGKLAKYGTRFVFIKGNIADKGLIDRLFAEYKPEIVVNFAAQAGVRYSISNPDAYIESNLIGFYNILEACRHSYDNDAEGVKLWFMLHRQVFMVVIKRYHIVQMIRLIILCHSTL